MQGPKSISYVSSSPDNGTYTKKEGNAIRRNFEADGSFFAIFEKSVFQWKRAISIPFSIENPVWLDIISSGLDETNLVRSYSAL